MPCFLARPVTWTIKARWLRRAAGYCSEVASRCSVGVCDRSMDQAWMPHHVQHGPCGASSDPDGASEDRPRGVWRERVFNTTKGGRVTDLVRASCEFEPPSVTMSVCKSSSQKRYNHFGEVEIGVLEKMKSLRKPLKVGSKLPRATRAQRVLTLKVGSKLLRATRAERWRSGA